MPGLFLRDGEKLDTRDSRLAAFRIHRHDVLNSLQLVKAYIQLNRPERAQASLDHLSQWLKSLGLWQTNISEESEALVWNASVCPNVHLDQSDSLERLDSAMREELMEAWRWLNEQANQNQVAHFSVRLQVQMGEDRDRVRALASCVQPASRIVLWVTPSEQANTRPEGVLFEPDAVPTWTFVEVRAAANSKQLD